MTRTFTFFSAILTIILFTAIISDAHPPKREMRATWLTTVWGLDWPGTKIPAGGGELYVNQQKQQLTRILDSLKVAGMNAVFFQVRSECDAMYPSSYEPWSAHLVASRGMNPGYDPLQFAVEECHKRGIELHAWLNPYRFESVAGKYAGQPGDYKQTNPEWVLSYSGGGAILDPGNPAVRKRISDIVREIITNYNVDGIIFDDYFYAYGGTPTALDQYSQSNWKPAAMNLHDWRRQNVNKMVADVYHTIQEVKPWVTFGVSPFGIWTVDPQIAAANGLTLPTGITGMDAYKSIYCDPIAWLREGTVDYISPQLYWPTTSAGQDYKKLAPWWSDVASQFGRHFYASHTLSNLDPSDYPAPVALKSAATDFSPDELQGLSMVEYFSGLNTKSSVAGFDPSEFGMQIQWNRNSDKNDAPGSVFFRATMFFTKGFMNYLRTNEYSALALPPLKPWNAFEQRSLPANLRIEDNLFVWDSHEENVRFSVYAIPNHLINEPGVFRDGKYLLGMSWTKSFDLTKYSHLVTGRTFAVAVFDRNGNEFPPVIMGQAPQQNHPVALIAPANGQSVFPGFSFRWNGVQNADNYILEVSSDSLFNTSIYRRSISEVTFSSVNIGLKVDSVYFWRVFTRMIGVEDEVSEVRQFELESLPKPEIIYPQNEAVAVDVMPVIQWEEFDNGFSFRMQISTNNSFTGVVFDQKNIEGTSYQLPAGTIFSFSTYFLRMQATNADSATIWSDVVRFSTTTSPPSIPVIIFPSEGQPVAGPGVKIEVREEPLARSITFQLSNSEAFPWNNRIQQSVDAPASNLFFGSLADGTWYVKARANYSASLFTDWSPVVSFSLLTTYAGEISSESFSLFSPTIITNEPLRIRYSIPESSLVRLYITDMTGRRIRVKEQAMRARGEHTLIMQTEGIQKGFYLLTLETAFGRKTLKLIK
jgi:uncharacterized lipoprotein YddW (UPF0748 family)